MNLSELQKRLKKFKLDAFLISRGNVFLGQDICDEENLIFQLTGFTGSAGTLLVTGEQSILFVDGRYELQAPRQVDKKLVQVVCTTHLSVSQWINRNYAGKKIGYHPWCWSIKEISAFIGPDMKQEPTFLTLPKAQKIAKLFEHDLAFCGQSREEKVSLLSQDIVEHDLDAYFVSSADSVSWLLNLRSDALCDTPVFRGMALVDTDRHVWIFADHIDTKQLSAKLTFLPLSELPARLKKFKKKSIGADFSSTSAAFFAMAEEYNVHLKDLPDFCQQRKALKNESELKGIRCAHIHDGVALCKFLCWLDSNWQGKSELDIVNKLHAFRAKQKNYVSESFSTIAAFGSNGAVVHYVPTPQTNKKLEEGSFLLLDSGAQYFDGTTDVTRTIALGNITPLMRDDFTLVLKAHIHLSKAIFPSSATGAQLDALTRGVLWQEGKTYHHGTGHGVGCFLNVHEGPAYISAWCRQTFSKGYVTSIEPGYYLENNYGIRIENLAEVCDAVYKDFLCFKNLTLVPIDKRAINKYLMDEDEIVWLNQYHETVLKAISPHLSLNERAWLQEACAPL